MVNKWKVFGLTIATWFILSLVAKMLGAAIHKDLISASATVWSWSSFIMGIVMKVKARQWREFGYGVVAFIVCLFPIIGIVAGIAYFARCYYQIELLAANGRESNSTEVLK